MSKMRTINNVAIAALFGPLLTVGVCAKIHVMPLVPHHVQKTRRSLSATATASSVDGILAEANVSSFHHPRRRAGIGMDNDDGMSVSALYQGYGTHYIDLWVGTPPQRTTVIVDTGSGVTAFPCSGCKKCGEQYHTDNYFHKEESSTYKKVPCDDCSRGKCSSSTHNECEMGMSYQEGSSWKAKEARDISYVGGLHTHPLLQDEGDSHSAIDPLRANQYSFELNFGCQFKLTGLFETQLADGIMGMDNVGSSFWAQAQTHGIMDKSNFSLCFSRQPTAEKEGTEAGAMTLGGFDPRLPNANSPMLYSSFATKSSGFYKVHLKKIMLRKGGAGDSAMPTTMVEVVTLNVSDKRLNRGNVIVDSGTTDSYFSSAISGEFKKAWKQLTGKDYAHDKMSLSAEQLDALPTILLQMEGDASNDNQNFDETTIGWSELYEPGSQDVILAIPPSHYMEYDAKTKQYVSRFYVTESGGSVIGANAMMGHDVNFDIDNKRIGWAESTCDYTALVNDNGFVYDPVDEYEKQVDEMVVDKDSKKTKDADSKDPSNGLQEPTDKSSESSSVGETVGSTIHQCLASTSCQGGAIGALLVLGIMTVFGVLRIRSKRKTNNVAYHASELEFPSLDGEDDGSDDDENFSRYRDDPSGEFSYDDSADEDVAAEEGVGYESVPTARDVV